MSKDIIYRQAAVDLVTDMEFMNDTAKGILRDRLRKLSSADVVSKNTYNQVKWERDTAIKQLEDLGYGFGEEVRNINRLKDEVGMMSEGW